MVLKSLLVSKLLRSSRKSKPCSWISVRSNIEASRKICKVPTATPWHRNDNDFHGSELGLILSNRQKLARCRSTSLV
ncbi:Uncharacterized protein HZ326_7610 [Fusarium oxysporum f. sp. albedinis]|nr:Uncharacterized protein HZ326_7610 [Fusarium oxysporum f. sp. albedinis]